MSQSSRFLKTPREIRDLIYNHYLHEHEGYHYDFESGKLRCSNGRSIDLAIMYTCKQIATETRHLALKMNVIFFKTIFSDKERLNAGRFGLMLSLIFFERRSVIMDFFAGNSDYPEIIQELDRKYSSLSPLRRKLTLSPRDEGGPPASLIRACVCDFLESACEYPRYAEIMEKYSRYSDEMVRLCQSPLLLSTPDPWTIPTREELVRMRKVIHRDWPRGQLWKRVKWRYSATAAAVRFLNSISPQIRLTIRSIVIHEDRDSVGEAPCHGLGLVRFCLENPQLRIQRKLDLWHTILRKYCDHKNHLPSELQYNMERRKCYVPSVAHYFTPWVDEMVALRHAGMPDEAFLLVIDAGGSIEEASQVVEILKKSLVWREARQQWLQNPSIAPEAKRHEYDEIISSESSQEILGMIEGKGNIQLGFPINDGFPNIADCLAQIERRESSRDPRQIHDICWDECVELVPRGTWKEICRRQLIPEGQLQAEGDSEDELLSEVHQSDRDPPQYMLNFYAETEVSDTESHELEI